MSIRLELPKVSELKPRITVIGVGGAGGNAVNNMIAAGLTGVEFIVANTDAQALASSGAELRIQLGQNLTEGLGAGSKPEIGRAAAEEAADEIRSQIDGSHMVFVAAGMGGGTGTGAAAVVARIARELGILVVAIVTKPFQFEGARRMRMAEAGIAELRQYVDTMIVIPNQNLFRVATERTTFAEAFVLADQVLYSGIACIVDLIVKEGLINLDFADVRTVLSEMGSAVMGTGEASGERRAVLAAEEAISNPLLDDVSLRGARGLLLSIIGGRNLTLYEVDEAASRVRAEVDPEANIIVGATFDDTLEDRVRVSIVASGMEMRAAEDRPAEQASARTVAQAARSTPTTVAQPAARPAPSQPPVPPPASAPALQSPPSVPQPMTQTAYPAPGSQPASVQQASVAPAGPTQRTQPEAARKSQGLPPALPGATAAHSPAPLPLPPALMPPTERDAEDYSRGMQAAYDPPMAGPNSDPSVWRSDDGVTIEDAMVPLGTTPSLSIPPPLPTASRGSRADEAGPGSGFEPQAPAEVRRPPRRVPEISEFPEVAQRDYRAKAQHTAERGLPPPPAARPGAFEPSTRRKQGLFERISSFGRRESDTEHAPHESAPDPHERSTTQPPAPARPQRRGAQPAPDIRPNSDQQQSDIPEFFDRRRR